MPFVQSALAACLAVLSIRSSAPAAASRSFMQWEEPPAVDPLLLAKQFEKRDNDRFKAMIQSHIC
jgi:hypothetical protein